MNKNYPYYEHKEISNLTELLALSIENNPDDIAFSFCNNDRKVIDKTYREFYFEVMDLKNYIASLYHDKHIAIIGENSYEWIVIFFAIILSGNTAVVIDKGLPIDVIEMLLNNSDTNIMFYSQYNETLANNKDIIGYPISDINKYETLGKKEKKAVKLDNDKCATIFFTSGTTGANKAVMLSQRNIANNTYAAASLFKPNGSAFSVLPFHHSFGLITSIIAPFFYHVKVFINTNLRNILNDLKIAKPNTMFVVPMFVEQFYKQIWSTARKTHKKEVLKTSIKLSNGLMKIGIDLRSKLFKSITSEFGGNLEYIICGGAFLNKTYVKWFRSIGINILNGYGITECSPVLAVNRNHFYRDGSVGQAIKDANVKIEDGEIVVKSKSVMLGYYKDKKSTNQVIKRGWFHTGDLGYIDKDGFIFITGRKKNLIILNNGENVSPELVEEVLGKDSGVEEVVVYAKNNRIVAEIFPTEEYIGDQEYFNALIYKYNKGLPKNRQIAMVNLRYEEFPKNNNRKILRNKI